MEEQDDLETRKRKAVQVLLDRNVEIIQKLYVLMRMRTTEDATDEEVALISEAYDNIASIGLALPPQAITGPPKRPKVFFETARGLGLLPMPCDTEPRPLPRQDAPGRMPAGVPHTVFYTPSLPAARAQAHPQPATWAPLPQARAAPAHQEPPQPQFDAAVAAQLAAVLRGGSAAPSSAGPAGDAHARAGGHMTPADLEQRLRQLSPADLEKLRLRLKAAAAASAGPSQAGSAAAASELGAAWQASTGQAEAGTPALGAAIRPAPQAVATRLQAGAPGAGAPPQHLTQLSGTTIFRPASSEATARPAGAAPAGTALEGGAGPGPAPPQPQLGGVLASLAAPLGALGAPGSVAHRTHERLLHPEVALAGMQGSALLPPATAASPAPALLLGGRAAGTAPPVSLGGRQAAAAAAFWAAQARGMDGLQPTSMPQDTSVGQLGLGGAGTASQEAGSSVGGGGVLLARARVPDAPASPFQTEAAARAGALAATAEALRGGASPVSRVASLCAWAGLGSPQGSMTSQPSFAGWGADLAALKAHALQAAVAPVGPKPPAWPATLHHQAPWGALGSAPAAALPLGASRLAWQGGGAEAAAAAAPGQHAGACTRGAAPEAAAPDSVLEGPGAGAGGGAASLQQPEPPSAARPEGLSVAGGLEGSAGAYEPSIMFGGALAADQPEALGGKPASPAAAAVLAHWRAALPAPAPLGDDAFLPDRVEAPQGGGSVQLWRAFRSEEASGGVGTGAARQRPNAAAGGGGAATEDEPWGLGPGRQSLGQPKGAAGGPHADGTADAPLKAAAGGPHSGAAAPASQAKEISSLDASAGLADADPPSSPAPFSSGLQGPAPAPVEPDASIAAGGCRPPVPLEAPTRPLLGNATRNSEGLE